MTLRPIKIIEDRLGSVIFRHRTAVLIASAMVLVITAFGVKNLTFDNNLRVFFSKENPQLVAFERKEAIYTKNDNVMFAIAPKNGDVFNWV